jgi:hypothetical protein
MQLRKRRNGRWRLPGREYYHWENFVLKFAAGLRQDRESFAENLKPPRFIIQTLAAAMHVKKKMNGCICARVLKPQAQPIPC